MAITGAEPVLYWPLGDNSNPNAPRGYPNISVGADSVFDFENSNQDYIEIPSVDELKPDRTLTISAWVKRESSQIQPIFDQGQRSGVLLWFNQASNPSTLGFYIQNGSAGDGSPNWLQYVSTATVPTNEWTHICVTLDKNAGNLRFYVNGEPPAFSVGVPVGDIGWSTTNPFTIGNHRGVYFMDGEISNVQFWDSVLSDSEVEDLFYNGQPLMTGTQPQESNLKAWYKLNQSANWEANAANTWQIPDAVSAYPQSFNFSKTPQEYIELGKDDWFNEYNNEITFSVWINKKNWSSTGFEGLISKYGTSGSTIQYRIAYPSSAGRLQFYLQGGPSGGPYAARINTVTLTSAQQASEWLHILWRHSASTSTSQVIFNGDHANAVSLTNIAGNPYAQPQTTTTNMIGNVSNGLQPFDGAISNYQRFNSYLDNAAVEALYNEGVPSTTAIATDNLKAWYKLDNTEKFDGTDWSIENQKYPASYESALKFPGDFVSGTGMSFSPLTINATQANTYSAWVYPIGNTAFWTMLMGDYSGSTSRIAPISLVNSGGSQWAIRSTQRSINTAANSVKSNPISNNELGKWHHIMVVVDNLDVSFYLNGQPHGTATFNNAWTSSTFNLFSIGKFGNWVANGYMSNIAIWDSDQSTNIANIYNNGTPQNSYTVEPIALWKLDNTTTGLNDVIGGKNGTLTGDITKVNTFVSTEAGVSSGMTEQSLVNNNVSVLNGESSGMNTINLVQSNLTRKQPFSNYSTKFDGIEYYTDTGGGFLNGATTASVSIWMKMDTIPSSGLYQPAVSCWGSSPLNQYLIRYRTGFGFEFYLGGPSGPSSAAFVVATSTATAVINTWYNVVGTWDGSEVKIYVNGAFGGSQTATSGSLNSSTQPNLVGRYSATNIDGNVSNTAFWTDTVLNEDDILNIYNNGVTQDLSNFRVPPTNWLPLDESYTYFNGSVMVARDVIGGGELDGVNVVQSDMVGNAPGSEAYGTGSNLSIDDLRGNMKSSDENAYSINMADYADGVTNPANSGRSTDTP